VHGQDFPTSCFGSVTGFVALVTLPIAFAPCINIISQEFGPDIKIGLRRGTSTTRNSEWRETRFLPFASVVPESAVAKVDSITTEFVEL